ncbi:F0F1 ATP synthase subunit A [Acaryochloris marina]|uniref:ATP synthase subunit a 2 n=1 Tax=Acaryochloris marina (strain MBIC 11017) TaxID=329726 RepID=ATP62_ACAM1|nr:F0F1 ATP synthase subunit A [Acaryochloris marina]A8ZNS1.1 RecName: Full=ATP synthase subunit a 2; AltName: Full=ATP synthase F0 sector subunit a 2; AltName: Full=F-ATPase subunit 6 2 [Acaryochloris marina MBIC11017]ABW32657.1 ATP synthase F0, A subunit [Acaryochloris marina MBIC11017]
MHLTPDQTIFWQWGLFSLNATLIFTWLVMGVLVVGSWFVTRHLSASTQISRGQNLLEVIVLGIRDQIQEIIDQPADPYLPFIGTLFIFIALSNLLSVIPGYQPPTGSLSTTTALALCVFFAVPLYGVQKKGVRGYLQQYLQPNPIMLPFNIIGDFSRIVALAVRLFGNVMSGTMIVGILLSVAPLFFPVMMQVLGLLTGVIQAYIFAILAMVFIAAASQVDQHNYQTDSEVSHG